MMPSTAVLIPTLGRPHRVPRLLENLAASTHAPNIAYFIVERDDDATLEAVRTAGARWIVNQGASTYASSINTGYRETTEPFLFLAADDVVFQEGWLEAALHAMRDPRIGVVGTADPYWPLPDHSSHSLVRRRYIEAHSGCLDVPDVVLFPYHHGFTDHELVGVAKARRAYLYCDQARVEHHHPGWDDIGRVRGGSELDETYRKGNRHHRRDTLTFASRSAHWMPLIQEPSSVDLEMRALVNRTRGFRGAIRHGWYALGDALRHATSRIPRADSSGGTTSAPRPTRGDRP
jgi:glycosyltransferase involved in cell wall biosynthesis